MLAYTSSRTSEKSRVRIRHQWILILYPPLRSKFMWIWEVLLIKMVSERLNKHSCPFLQLYTLKHHLFLCYSHKTRCRWRCHPNNLILNAFQVIQLLQNLNIVNIFLSFNKLLNLFSQLLLNFWIIANEVNHTSQEIGCCVCSSQ